MSPARKSPRATTDRPAASLSDKIARRTARVGVAGLGYVGLPTAIAATTAGFDVTGIDIDRVRVDEVNAGRSHVKDVGSDVLAPLVEAQRVTATTDYAAVENVDVIVICVPTPVNSHKEPDLGPLREAVGTMAQHMRGEQLVVLQSTTYPGTTEDLVLPQIQKDGGRRVGKDFYLAFSPERIDPGNQEFTIDNIPKVVGGVTPQCTAMAADFFSTFVERVIQVGSPKVAEMTKLLENIFRSVNIALVNELSEACHRMGIDIWEVINAAASKPFGFMPFYPGIGVGGHCIPVDPFYLSWKAKEYDSYVNFIELAAKTNDNRPYYAVSRIVDVLGGMGKTAKGARLLLLGVSFKKDIGDTRNSPALRVAELLSDKGATIAFSDPHVPEVTIGGRHLKSVDLNETELQQHDATIILVNHGLYDIGSVVRHSRLVIDTGDTTRQLGPSPTVVRL